MVHLLLSRKKALFAAAALVVTAVALFAGGLLVGLHLQIAQDAAAAGPATAGDGSDAAAAVVGLPSVSGGAGAVPGAGAAVPGAPGAGAGTGAPAASVPGAGVSVPPGSSSGTAGAGDRDAAEVPGAEAPPSQPIDPLQDQEVFDLDEVMPSPSPPAPSSGRPSRPASSVAVAALPSRTTELVAEEVPEGGRDAEGEREPEAGAGRYALQVGAYGDHGNLERAMAELERRGYEPYVVEVEAADGRRLATVRIGRYEDREAAREAARAFTARESLPVLVRR